MSCDVGEGTEWFEDEALLILQPFFRFNYITAHSPHYQTLPSQLILQPFCRFSYVTGSSPTSPCCDSRFLVFKILHFDVLFMLKFYVNHFCAPCRRYLMLLIIPLRCNESKLKARREEEELYVFIIADVGCWPATTAVISSTPHLVVSALPTDFNPKRAECQKNANVFITRWL